MDIQSQITWLRCFDDDEQDCRVANKCADTMQLMLDVREAAKDVYEFAEPTSELQQVDMLILHDALKALNEVCTQ